MHFTTPAVVYLVVHLYLNIEASHSMHFNSFSFEVYNTTQLCVAIRWNSNDISVTIISIKQNNYIIIIWLK